VLPPQSRPAQFDATGPSSLVAAAREAVSRRARRITYSFYPVQTVPWGSMIARDMLNALVVTAAHAVFALAILSVLVRAPCRRGAGFVPRGEERGR
jgi:hypothetical protein